MAKKQTINIVVAKTDPIMGTTYTTEPRLVQTDIHHAKEQYAKVQSVKAQKLRGERTKHK